MKNWLANDAIDRLHEVFPEITRIRVRNGEHSIEMHFNPRLFIVVPVECVEEILSSQEILEEWHEFLIGAISRAAA